MIKGYVNIDRGQLRDIQARVERLGLNAKDLRRPNAFIGQEMVVRNRRRLAGGVDVNGLPLKSKLSSRLGLVPLGGADRTPGRSIKWQHDGSGLELFSTWIGARVAYRGDVIRPRLKKWLTIPMEARGGEAARGSAGLSMEGNRTGRRALHYKNTFFLRISGRLFLVQKDKRSRALRFLFFLTKSVRYPKNEWMGFSESDLEMAVNRYGDHLDTFSGKPVGGK